MALLPRVGSYLLSWSVATILVLSSLLGPDSGATATPHSSASLGQ
jgi:hypothetical protein